MKTKSQIKQGETTNVRSSSVIDFAPLDTVSREDDKEQWATPQFYCESDKEESEYVPPKSANLRKAEAAIGKAKFRRIMSKIYMVTKEVA